MGHDENGGKFVLFADRELRLNCLAIETGNEPKSPRGVRGFQLNTGNFSTWRVQGKIGGYTEYESFHPSSRLCFPTDQRSHYLSTHSFPDKFRGVLNEGGLFGERHGWHLPGFDTSSWASRDLSSGLPNDTAGVGFFVTTFKLSMPSGFDVMMSFNFEDIAGNDGQPYRALLFVNGWMMGKRVGNLG